MFEGPTLVLVFSFHSLRRALEIDARTGRGRKEEKETTRTNTRLCSDLSSGMVSMVVQVNSMFEDSKMPVCFGMSGSEVFAAEGEGQRTRRQCPAVR